MFKGIKMASAFTSIWTDCKLLIGTIGIIGIAIGWALLDSAEAADQPNDKPKKEKTGLKYTGLAILLISICAVGVNIYYLYQKKCRKVIYDWNSGNI